MLPSGMPVIVVEAPVDQLYPMIRAPHDHALQHAVQCGVELKVGAPQGRLTLPAGDQIGSEHLDRMRHGADLVTAFRAGHRKIGVARSELVHHRRQAEHRTRDATADKSRTEQGEHGGAETETEQRFLGRDTVADGIGHQRPRDAGPATAQGYRGRRADARTCHP